MGEDTQTPITKSETPKTTPNISFLLSIFIAILLVSTSYLGNQNIILQQKLSDLLSLPSPTPLPTPASDTTANWKTYFNEQYNFTIKHPQDWTNREPPVILESPPQPNTTIPKYSVNIFVHPKASRTFEEIAENNGKTCVGNCPETGDDTKVLGKDYRFVSPTVEKTTLNGFDIYYVTPHDSKGYYFPIIPIPNNDKDYIWIFPGFWPRDEDYSLFNQIFSTFEFTK